MVSLSRGKPLKTRCYARKRPAFWKNSLLLGCTGRLFPIVIDIDMSEITSDGFRALCLSSRHPLPPIEPFKIFYSGFSVEVNLRRCNPILVSAESLLQLHQFSTRVIRAVSGKPLENALEKAPYFLAPLKYEWKMPRQIQTPRPRRHFGGRPSMRVSRGTRFEAGATHWFRPLRASTIEELGVDLDDAIIQDRKLEFANKFDAVRLRRELPVLFLSHKGSK